MVLSSFQSAGAVTALRALPAISPQAGVSNRPDAGGKPYPAAVTQGGWRTASLSTPSGDRAGWGGAQGAGGVLRKAGRGKSLGMIPHPLPGSASHLKQQVKRVEQQASERITLSVPGRPEYVVVVRLAAAAIAGRMAFSYDEIEDLKVAVGEVCTAAILEGGPEVGVVFEVGRDRLAVEVRYRPDHRGRSRREEDLDKLLVRVLMDQVTTELDGSDRITRLVKLVTQ